MQNKHLWMRTSLILAAVALGLGLTSAAALGASEGPPPPPPPPHQPFGRGLQQALDQLQLTDAQATAIGQLLDAQRQAADAHRAEMMAAQKALKDQIIAETFDEAAIRQASATAAALEANRAVADAALLRDVRALLTPEQRTALQTYLESHGPGSEGPGRPGGFGGRTRRQGS